MTLYRSDFPALGSYRSKTLKKHNWLHRFYLVQDYMMYVGIVRTRCRKNTELKKRIVKSYKTLTVRLYCEIRYRIITTRILEEIGQYLSPDGRILDIGCGFGLFSLYYALQSPSRKITAYDFDEGRILAARSSAETLGLKEQVTFECQDAVSVCEDKNSYDGAYLLDILHHVPPSEHEGIIRSIHHALTPDGVLLIKEIDIFPRWKVLFTWILDMAVNPGMPPHYVDRAKLSSLLTGMGFDVKIHSQLDLLPYPHVLYVCRKKR